jgi:hypothetical protein
MASDFAESLGPAWRRPVAFIEGRKVAPSKLIKADVPVKVKHHSDFML